jgi:glutathione S-transferase
VLDVKQIPYRKVVHPPYSHKDPQAQQELYEWTAQTSVPTMVYNDGSGKPDLVRNDWLNQLMLAEQIQPEPSLIPRDAGARVLMFGLSHEIMSPQGLMWNGRLCMRDLTDMSNLTPKQRDFFTPENFLGGKYSLNAKQRSPLDNIRECLALLDDQLARNQAAGSRFFVGDALSALDIYWAYGSIMVRLLPHEEMPVMTINRDMYLGMNEALAHDVPERLLEHRNFIFHEFLACPMSVD